MMNAVDVRVVLNVVRPYYSKSMAPATNAARPMGRTEMLPMGTATFCRPPLPLLPLEPAEVAAASGSTATKDVAVTRTTSPLEAVDVKVDLTSLYEVVRGVLRVVVVPWRVVPDGLLAAGCKWMKENDAKLLKSSNEIPG